ncbi:hypothetical protein BJ508DRAFT_359032 [Ascobolus immersus RN42]|uniref:FAD-binding FR-type domain-containing protein n=1 Tax=Ascobolus immersus RN42 TaxID=1160509 RepID=A0A3N4IIN9_ASCIM|nr:hypothetical protein BJ508DRAFT_359032 [Ascobolus immersus RN42]
MSYEWKFLTSEEKAIRRTHLDWKGQQSLLLSVLCFLIPLAVPYTPLAEYLSRPQVRTTRYWLFQRGPFLAFLPDHGSIGLWMGALLYAAVLLWLAMKNTAPDAFFLIKAFGIVAGAQLPAVYALGMKNGIVSPARVWGWERGTKWHMWGARILVWLLAGHFVGYMIFFVSFSRLGRLVKLDIIAGELAFFSMVVMGATGLMNGRPGAYRLFQKIHILVAPCLLPLCYLHVSHLRPYVLITAVLYILDTVLHRPLLTTLTLVPHRTFTEININIPPGVSEIYRRGYGHVFLRIPELDNGTKHPFTIASYSPLESSLKVTVRTKGGWTKELAHLAREKEGRRVVGKVWTIGGEEAVVEECAAINDVVLIGAGVGIGWASSVGREFVRLGKHVKVIAVAKSSEEVAVLGGADAEDVSGALDMCVYLTAELGIVTEMEGKLRGLDVRYGRPDWEEALAQVVLGARDGEAFVGVCGPAGLVKGVSRTMGRWVGSSNVRVWNEGYSD